MVLLACGITTGIGTLTAATVLAGTTGFELIRNKRQLTGYAGLGAREKPSGTSVKGGHGIKMKAVAAVQGKLLEDAKGCNTKCFNNSYHLF